MAKCETAHWTLDCGEGSGCYLLSTATLESSPVGDATASRSWGDPGDYRIGPSIWIPLCVSSSAVTI
jgi:hypothetical protein